MSGPPPRRARRTGARTDLVGGRRAVLEAIRSGRARHVTVARGTRRTSGMRELLAEAARAGLEVRWEERVAVDATGVPDHQGVVAAVSAPTDLDERALAGLPFGGDALVVVLDGITDPQNLGACARTAEAAGATVLVVRRRRGAPPTGTALRASAGALLHLPLARVTNLVRAIESLKAAGFTVVGLDHRAPATIHEAPVPDRPLAIVLGSEGEGISRLVRESCDALVSIPMRGRTASLNAAAALAVGLFGYALRPGGQGLPARLR